MQHITLCIKIYGNIEKGVETVNTVIINELKELDIKAQIHISTDGWVNIELSGEDEEFASNLLIKKYGTPVHKPLKNSIYKGYIDNINEDCICVDIGVKVYILSKDMKNLGIGNSSQIATRFGMIEYLPVEIEIIDSKQLLCQFSKLQTDTFWKWKKSTTDRVIANSITRSELKAAIKKTGHARDIYGIERLGILEHAIICKESTDGPGIVAAIGKLIISKLGVIIASV